MKNVKLRDGKIRILEIPEPQIISPTQVKIKVAYSSICGYEMLCYEGNADGDPNGDLGHEASGTIIGLGRDVTNFHLGDSVSLSPYFYCGYCENCRKGMNTYCLNSALYVSPPFMAEYVVLDQTMVYRLPDNMSLIEGCLIEPLSVAIRAVEKACLGYNKKLLIIGGGSMGQLALQVALKYPIDNAVLIDPNQNKRELALKHGAALALNPNSEDLYYHLMDHTNSLGYDAVIEALGDTASVTTGFNVLGRGGSLVLLSMYETDFQFPIRPLSIYWKDATIQAVYPAADPFLPTINLAQRLNVADIITGIYPYMQAGKAFEEKSTNHMHIKVMLDFRKEGLLTG